MKLPFQYHDLKHLERGGMIQVTLQGAAANIRLLDSSDFRKFKAGQSHTIAGGGLMKRSPMVIKVPRSGHWYLTLDRLGMKPHQVRWGVQVLPPTLPVMRSAPLSQQSVSSLPLDVREPIFLPTAEDTRVFDVFISHASEDKDIVARPLANALKGEGLEVWYDEFELRIGDSLRQKIDYGLAHSRTGVVIFSEDFFRKKFPAYELDGLVNMYLQGQQRFMPIWHEVGHTEVAAYKPSLADKLGRSTDDFTVEEIAAEIAEILNEAKAA